MRRWVIYPTEMTSFRSNGFCVEIACVKFPGLLGPPLLFSRSAMVLTLHELCIEILLLLTPAQKLINLARKTSSNPSGTFFIYPAQRQTDRQTDTLQ